MKVKYLIQIIVIVILITIIIYSVEKVDVDVTSEMSEKAIYIDPGHGGMDGGCVGNDGTLEKDVNLQISLELRDILCSMGYIVELTRLGDYDLSDKNSTNHKHDDIIRRCELMDNCLLYVSIHCNSYPGNVSGAQTFYSNEEGKELASYIQNSLKQFVKTNRKENKINDKYILDNTNAIGCIVEVGFLSNFEELQLLKNSDYKRRVAYAIAIGINDYLNKRIKSV